MRELAGRTAFVTGGAGGIGLSMASAFAQAGMKVMIADIETNALDAAVENLRRITPDIDGSIGVSVLCPSYVRTKIGESGRNRPERYGASQPLDPASPAAAMVAEIAKNLQGGRTG